MNACVVTNCACSTCVLTICDGAACFCVLAQILELTKEQGVLYSDKLAEMGAAAGWEALPKDLALKNEPYRKEEDDSEPSHLFFVRK